MDIVSRHWKSNQSVPDKDHLLSWGHLYSLLCFLFGLKKMLAECHMTEVPVKCKPWEYLNWGQCRRPQVSMQNSFLISNSEPLTGQRRGQSLLFNQGVMLFIGTEWSQAYTTGFHTALTCRSLAIRQWVSRHWCFIRTIQCQSRGSCQFLLYIFKWLLAVETPLSVMDCTRSRSQ